MANKDKSVSVERQSVVPHLVVKGAAEAIDFYVKAFEAKELYRMPTPEGLLMHASLAIGNSQIYLCDEFPNQCSSAPTTLGGTPVTIHLNVEDVDATYARSLEAGAEALMPPDDMFWGDRYGQVVDPFGHRWSMATPVESVDAEQMAERMSKLEPQGV